MNELKQRSLRGLLWAASESLGVAILSLGSFIIIARMLDPGDVGAVTLAGAVVICLNLVIAHGFSDALVQMPEVSGPITTPASGLPSLPRWHFPGLHSVSRHFGGLA